MVFRDCREMSKSFWFSNELIVVDAVFKANMAVKEKYISPVVYACLHLFGNPFLHIGDRPALGVIE